MISMECIWRTSIRVCFVKTSLINLSRILQTKRSIQELRGVSVRELYGFLRGISELELV
jgi:hypothetical protein